MRRLVLAAWLIATPGAASATPPTTTSTAPIQIRFDDAFLRATGDDLEVTGQSVDRPLLAEWWFWGAVAAVAAGVVATGLVLSSGGTFVPDGELGNSSTSEWTRF